MSGGLRRTIAILRDITTELELCERLALHVMIADGTNRAVIIVDRNMKIAYVNATFVGNVRSRDRETRGRHVDELLAGPHPDRRVLKRLQRCIATESGVDAEILAHDSNGDENGSQLTSMPSATPAAGSNTLSR